MWKLLLKNMYINKQLNFLKRMLLRIYNKNFNKLQIKINDELIKIY